MKITANLDYQTILANQPAPIYFALRLEASAQSAARPMPAAFCLVLDRSGSMEGRPLQGAKEAAQVAIQIEVGTRGIAPDHLRRYIAIAGRRALPYHAEWVSETSPAAGKAKRNSAADGQSRPAHPGRRPESIRKPKEGERMGVRVQKQTAKRGLPKKPKPRSEPC